MTDVYGRYARVYDSVGQSRFSLGMIDFVVAELSRFGVEGGALLDLACGTGAAALDLEARGFRVTGVDRSAAMLREARRKARAAGVPAKFVRSDIRSLSFERRFDVATCLYDSLNYLLTLEDAAAALEAGARALRPGGTFIFDFNSPHQYEVLDGREMVCADSDELFGVYRSRYDSQSRTNEFRMTFFEKRGSGYRRWGETHVQRAYTPDEMRRLATSAGLTCRRAVPLPEDSEACTARRWAFVCQVPLDYSATAQVPWTMPLPRRAPGS